MGQHIRRHPDHLRVCGVLAVPVPTAKSFVKEVIVATRESYHVELGNSRYKTRAAMAPYLQVMRVIVVRF